MKKTILFMLILASCNEPGMSFEDIKGNVKNSFELENQVHVVRVELLKVDDYNYTGYAVHEDSSKSTLDVIVDKQDPNHILWRSTCLSPLVIKKKLERIQ